MLAATLRLRFWQRVLLIGALGLSTGNLDATEQAAEDKKVSDDDLQIKGVFDSVLPGTEKKNRLKFLFRPHFGDFHRRDYLRLPAGLRYGLTEHWEITGELEGYFSHGFGNEKWFDKSGISNMRFRTKYRLQRPLLHGWDTGIGLDYLTPVGRPPADISDGLRHFSTFVSFSRELEQMPGWRVFWSVGIDDVATTDRPVVLNKNELGDDSGSVSGGFVWQRATHSYTLEMAYATTRLTGTRDRESVTVRPGIIWKLPKRYTFNSKGDWLLGVSTRLTYGTDGYDYGLSGKLRVSFDFKKWWRSHFPNKSK